MAKSPYRRDRRGSGRPGRESRTDLCCGSTYNSLVQAFRSNYITPGQIDVALYRILESRFKLGLFDATNLNPFLEIGTNQLDTPEHRQVALQLARESMVLLKNDGILPLDRTKIKTIAVFGENASAQRMLYGNYNGTPTHATTILEGISRLAGPGVHVTYAEGCPVVERGTNAGRGRGGFGGRGGQPAAPQRPLAELQAEAMSNAANADILIYVGGINSQLEGEEGNAGGGGIDGFNNGDRTRIELPQIQENLMRMLAATGKPLIFVNCSGSAMAIPWEAEHLPAILQAWYPGEEGGTAVGEVLFGDYQSGRPPADNVLSHHGGFAGIHELLDGEPDLPLLHRGAAVCVWAWPELHAFRLLEADAGQREGAGRGHIKVTFTVANRGARDGDEVAQVYFRHLNSAVPQPSRRCAGLDGSAYQAARRRGYRWTYRWSGFVIGTRQRRITRSKQAITS